MNLNKTGSIKRIIIIIVFFLSDCLINEAVGIGNDLTKNNQVYILQLENEYNVWSPITFFIQNTSDKDLICSISLEWMVDGKRSGAEIPDIAAKTVSKKARAWIIKSKSSKSITWNPKETPDLYYKGHKGQGRFIAQCRTHIKEKGLEKFKVKSKIFTIK